MSPFATVKSVRRAGRVIKRLMNYHPEGWGDVREAGRDGLRRCLEEEIRGTRQYSMTLHLGTGLAYPEFRHELS